MNKIKMYKLYINEYEKCQVSIECVHKILFDRIRTHFGSKNQKSFFIKKVVFEWTHL